jgi:hypothetical protein
MHRLQDRTTLSILLCWLLSKLVKNNVAIEEVSVILCRGFLLGECNQYGRGLDSNYGRDEHNNWTEETSAAQQTISLVEFVHARFRSFTFILSCSFMYDESSWLNLSG